MNISLACLAVAHVLSGPYLAMAPMSQRSTLSIGSSRFASFFSHCLFSSAALRLNVQRSVFSHFQSSAISLSREDFTGEPGRVDRQQGSGTEPATFTECRFDGCSDPNYGGAIFTRGYLVSIDSCGFFDCTAGKNGGAIAAAAATGSTEAETGWDWIGTWGNLETLPGIEINKTCFSQCFVTGDKSGTNENDKLGFVLYAHATQMGMFDFSAIDCSRSGAQHASVFFAWSNDVLTKHGNLSIGSEFVGEDVSAFRVMYAGYKQSDKYHPGSYTGIPAVNHNYHHTDGFKSTNVYWAHLKEGLCSHVLDYIDVTNTQLNDGGAIFYAYWDDPKDTSGNQLQVKNCNVFKVTGQNTKLHGRSDEISIQLLLANCKTDVEAWAVEGQVVVTQNYTPNELVMENEQYCILPDPASDSSYDAYSSDSGDSGSDPDNTEDDPDAGAGTGNNDRPLDPGAIAGIVIGILLLIALIILLIFFLIWRRKRTSSSENSKEENENEMVAETTTTQTGADAGIATVNYNQTQLNQIFEMSDSAMFEDEAEESI